MPIDIIIYVIIAVGLFMWLRFLLRDMDQSDYKAGESDNKSQRIEPKEQEPPSITPEIFSKDVEIIIKNPGDEEITMNDLEEPALDPDLMTDIKDAQTKNELVQISLKDRNFNLKEFLENAEDAFVYIIQSFADGDLKSLKDLLAPKVYDAFFEAIKQREARAETLEVDVHAVKDVQIRKAWREGSLAYIALRFVAMETVVVMDKDDKIISGSQDRVSEKIDVWTFGRNLRTADPRWFLFETDMDDGTALHEDYNA